MSVGKIFWRIIRHAAKRSWKRFKTLGEIVTNIIYVVAAAVVLKCLSKELGDTVIYWALAIPPLLWWVYFIWHSVKLLHRITPRKFPMIVVILLFFCASFMVLYVIQFSMTAKLKKQLNPPRQPSVTKPDEIIPSPAKSNTPTIISTTQNTNPESPIQFETSYPSPKSDDPKNELAVIKARKLAAIAAQKEAERSQNQSDTDNFWNQMLPTYRDCLETFHEVLKNEANETSRTNELVQKSVNYGYLPTTINYELEETNISEIKFKNQTNMDFHISIRGFYPSLKALRISADCGYFEIHHANIYMWHKCNVIIRIPTQNIDEDQTVEIDQAHGLIDEDLRSLKDGQIAYLSQTNK